MSTHRLFPTYPSGAPRLALLDGAGQYLDARALLERAATVAEFLTASGAGMARLAPCARLPSLVALLGAAAAGVRLTLLGSRGARASEDDESPLLGTALGGSNPGVLDLDNLAPAEAPKARDIHERLERLPADQVWSTLLTSGTTGLPEQHDKTVRQLLGEVETLVKVLGWTSDDVVLATVPGHHLYGLLFSLLLPLVSGAALNVDPATEPENFHPETLAELARRTGATRLVTVPAHLRTLLDADFELGPLRQVVCSAAALDPQWARQFEARYGVEVVDVLGSTETGGVALRRPSQGPAWTPLPGVELRTDASGQLFLRSPFARGEEEFETGDRVELLGDGRLLYLGRSDGVVKIGGKRISLQEIEREARVVSGVRDAVARSRAVPGMRGEEIWLLVEADGLSPVELRMALRSRLDPVFLPRRIRVVSRLPRSDRGKVERAAFEAAFAAAEPMGPGEKTIEVPEDSPRFAGHFPDEPIYPAVAELVDWILPAARRLYPELELARLSRLKFLEPIRPGQRLVLRLVAKPAEAERNVQLAFELSHDARKVATGWLSLRPSRR